MSKISKNQFFIDIFRDAEDNTAKQGGDKAYELGLGIHGLSEEENYKNRKKGGDVSGNNNKESGWASELGKEWGAINQEYANVHETCEHCGETTNLGNLERYHKDGICKERSEFEQRVVESYESGISIGGLVKEFGRDRASIYNMLVKNNADIRVNQKLTEEDVWDILVQLDNGVSRIELKDMYGVSKPTIAHIAQGRSWPKVQEKYGKYKNK